MKKYFVSMLVLLALAGLIVAGCSQKKVAPSQESSLTSQDQLDARKDDKFRTQQDGSRIPSESITEKQLSRAQTDDIESTVRELQKKIQDVYFEYDKYDIREDSKAVIKGVAEMLSKNQGIKVVIEGHCDDRGTNEYNLGLGDRRANSVKNYLMSLGVPSKRIEIVSYGEEKPVCKEANESCWSKNRRAHFVLLGER